MILIVPYRKLMTPCNTLFYCTKGFHKGFKSRCSIASYDYDIIIWRWYLDVLCKYAFSTAIGQKKRCAFCFIEYFAAFCLRQWKEQYWQAYLEKG